MSIQYSDTQFSENMPIDIATKRFQKELANGTPIQAFHIGTDETLTARKNNLIRQSHLQNQMDALQNAVDELSSKIVNNLNTELSNQNEIKRFTVKPK